MELSKHDLAILELERSLWTEAGSKEAAIVSQLGLTVTRYYELLNVLIDRPDAERYDPMVVRRLRRIREQRRQSRQDILARASEELSQ
ncbi:MAG: DUF3263 domain-containing protein [Actinobacteria bacterium]|jgi:hypothetical protein|nr:DUF3263 domain-containing protein [Actinomycetota bacterium]NCG38911.1 DUF3263 domain-containing protein [Actinomycetota bacterium]